MFQKMNEILIKAEEIEEINTKEMGLLREENAKIK